MDAYIGFDSAWMDNQKAFGAICSMEMHGRNAARFVPPQLVNFAQAADFVAAHRSPSGLTLVAIDQPTIVMNVTSMRPVERVVGTNFLDERNPIAGIGPITVEPGDQNAKVGLLLMEAVMDRARERGFAGMRLLQ